MRRMNHNILSVSAAASDPSAGTSLDEACELAKYVSYNHRQTRQDHHKITRQTNTVKLSSSAFAVCIRSCSTKLSAWKISATGVQWDFHTPDALLGTRPAVSQHSECTHYYQCLWGYNHMVLYKFDYYYLLLLLLTVTLTQMVVKSECDWQRHWDVRAGCPGDCVRWLDVDTASHWLAVTWWQRQQYITLTW